MPMEKTLDNKHQHVLISIKTKIDEYAYQNGIVDLCSSHFLLIPVWSLDDETLCDMSMFGRHQTLINWF